MFFVVSGRGILCYFVIHKTHIIKSQTQQKKQNVKIKN
jgi:hypothetical protein